MALENSEIFRSVVESLPTGIYIVDRERRIQFWNRGAERISGHLRHEVLGRSCRDEVLEHCDESGESLCQRECPLGDAMRDGRERTSNLFLRHKSGHLVPVHVRAIPLRDSKEAIVGAVEVFGEHRGEAYRDLQQSSLALHGCLDEVTNLPNPAFSRFQLQTSLARLNTFGIGFGVLRIRAEALASVTASRGKQAANAVMREVAQTLQHVSPDAALAGLWESDAFLVLLPEMTVHELSGYAGEIQRMIAHSEVRWWGDSIHIRVQVGGAVAQRGESLEQLLQRASPGEAHGGSLRPERTAVSGAGE